MRLGIRLCFILLVMFSVAAAKEVKNSSNGYENDSSFDTPSIGINEFSEETEAATEVPVVGLDEDSSDTETGSAGEEPPDENVEYTGEDKGVIQDTDTQTAMPPDGSFDDTPANEIFEHFKPNEDEGFAVPSEIPPETNEELDQKLEAEQPAESPASRDGETDASERRRRDQEEQIKLNNEYEEINRKKEVLDGEFKDIEKERNRLVEVRENLKTNADILVYKKETEALNQRIAQYDEKQKAYDNEVQDFNMRVQKDMERKIKEAEDRNIEINYEALDETADSSFEVTPYKGLDVDKSAPIEEQRKIVLKYKAQIEKEYQMLMKQRSEIYKQKDFVKTVEEVNALNKKTSELNKKIVEYEQKRIRFDKDIDEFNSRMESQFTPEQEEVVEEQ